jgi:hypothetical protein
MLLPEQQLMAKVHTVFYYIPLYWLVTADVTVVFINPGLDSDRLVQSTLYTWQLEASRCEWEANLL